MSDPSSILGKMYAEETLPKLYPAEEKQQQSLNNVEEVLQTNIFNVMLNRRSQRKFEKRQIEEWKIDIIFAAADTAPTAGGFQGFEIYHVKTTEIKEKLVKAANNQPYVYAPTVLVFCMNPARVKMNFSKETLKKFSLQDATLAASYAQLAAHALGLSTIWIGMIDEEKVKEAINTELTPSSILCIGYPQKMLQPKQKRSLTDLIHNV